MPDEQILRTVPATDVDGAEGVWPCGWCGARVRVVDGWVVDHEDVIAGQALRAFVCGRCARTAARRASVSAVSGRQRCSRCASSCPEGGVVLGRVDDVAVRQVVHVPLCRPCAEEELGELGLTEGPPER